MADTSYQPKVYLKQGAEDFIVASGGQAIVESGGEIEIESGGALSVESGGVATLESGGKITAESGGEFEGQSGATFDAQSGFSFYLGDTTAHTSTKIGNIVRSLITFTNYGSDGVSVLSIPTVGSYLNPAYGFAFFSLAAGCSKASFKLPVPVSGAFLQLHFSGVVSNAAMSFFAQSGGGLTGCSCQTVSATNVSSFNLAASTHGAVLKLRCFTDGCWTIVDRDDSSLSVMAAA